MIINQQPPSGGGGGGGSTYTLYDAKAATFNTQFYDWDTNTWGTYSRSNPMMVAEGTHVLIRLNSSDNLDCTPSPVPVCTTGNKPLNYMYYYALVMPDHSIVIHGSGGN